MKKREPSECVRMRQSASECVRVLAEKQECVIMRHKASECVRVLAEEIDLRIVLMALLCTRQLVLPVSVELTA